MSWGPRCVSMTFKVSQGSLRLLRSTGIQALGAGSTDQRGPDRPQSPSGPDPLASGVANSARGRPPDLSPGTPDGATSPGAALTAPVGLGRPGPVWCSSDGLGRRAVPALGAAELLGRRRLPTIAGTPELWI
ncbi:hypothetical protein NDU88_003713 [Pleurodeles waltl]|uniref:Uncharacterized protein n=1 Tax=Pleurodeles waltl TaxID=8319 RepID=A0AAV7WTU7_PLEWA|nr:hypothetical protein NDU88_003713 [Pleurodeles waltl]